jgi:hypothetical protein
MRIIPRLKPMSVQHSRACSRMGFYLCSLVAGLAFASDWYPTTTPWCSGDSYPPLAAQVNGIACIPANSPDNAPIAMIMEPVDNQWATKSQTDSSGPLAGYITSGYPLQLCNGGNSIQNDFVVPMGSVEKDIYAVQAACKKAGGCNVWPLKNTRVDFQLSTLQQALANSPTVVDYPPEPDSSSETFAQSYDALAAAFLNLYLNWIYTQFDGPSNALNRTVGASVDKFKMTETLRKQILSNFDAQVADLGSLFPYHSLSLPDRFQTTRSLLEKALPKPLKETVCKKDETKCCLCCFEVLGTDTEESCNRINNRCSDDCCADI